MPTKETSSTHFFREITIALAVYSIITLIFLGNALSSHGANVIGHEESDVWKHLWGAWWMNTELSQGRFPVWTDLQNFPNGGRLYVIDPLNAVCTALLMPLLGLVSAYNLTQALQLLAASLSAWALARWLTNDHRAALVAGAIYGFCPFVLSSGIASGIDETSNIAWIPLSILGLMMCANGQAPLRGIILGGIGLALAAIGSWYYGMTAAIFWLFSGVWALSTRRVPAGPASSVNWLYPISACLLSALLALPLALLFAQSLKGDSSLLGQVNITERQEKHHLEFMYHTFDFKNNAIMSSYFLPGKDKLSIATDVDRRLKTVYIGLLALVLAGFGFWKARRASYYWLSAAVLFGVLSLGPYLALSPSLALPKPWSPFYLFAYYVIPGFRMVAICDRLSIGVQISIAMMAALGLRQLLPRDWRGLVLALLLICVIVAELIFVSPVPWPIYSSDATIPQVYQELAKRPERRGLISLPLNRFNHQLQPGEYYYWQTFHHKPLPATLTTRFSDAMMSNRLVGALYLCEDDNYISPPDTLTLVPGLIELKEAGFGWITINSHMVPPRVTNLLNTILTPMLGRPQILNHDKLYDLYSPQADTWIEKYRQEQKKNDKQK